MGFKKIKKEFSFADVVLESSKKNNRSIQKMRHLNKSINWNRVEDVLMSHYTVGTSNEGADAYPPLLLFKCLLLQKWFRINSDPELENMINDRWSFKEFLNFPLSKPAPDHSTFSRFRQRLSKEAMDQINSEILRQFESQGLTINEGIAVDARLVKSASRPISNDKIKEAKDRHNTPEGKLDKNGNPIKFHRDLDSDWTIKNDEPHYGLKEHASVDTHHGFVLATKMTPASVNDTNYLPYCTVYSRHTKQQINKVFADKGYAGKPNRDFLALNCRTATIFSAALPSPYSFGHGLSVLKDLTALTIFSRSAPTTTFHPASTVSTHSVSGRNVTQGTPIKYASFCIPPESVRIEICILLQYKHI